MATLYELAGTNAFAGMHARLTTLCRPHAIEELLYRDDGGYMALHFSLHRDCSLELLSAMCDVMKSDPQKRNIFAMADNDGFYPLHNCALLSTRVDVLQFVIDMFPHALVGRADRGGVTPLLFVRGNTSRANHAALVRCIEDNAARYPALLNQLTVKCCMVRLKKQGTTAIVARIPRNEQTPSQFVYELLDMMVNSEMKAMAEDIISFVGTNVGLPVPAGHAMKTRSKKAKIGEA